MSDEKEWTQQAGRVLCCRLWIPDRPSWMSEGMHTKLRIRPAESRINILRLIKYNNSFLGLESWNWTVHSLQCYGTSELWQDASSSSGRFWLFRIIFLDDFRRPSSNSSLAAKNKKAGYRVGLSDVGLSQGKGCSCRLDKSPFSKPIFLL